MKKELVQTPDVTEVSKNLSYTMSEFRKLMFNKETLLEFCIANHRMIFATIRHAGNFSKRVCVFFKDTRSMPFPQVFQLAPHIGSLAEIEAAIYFTPSDFRDAQDLVDYCNDCLDAIELENSSVSVEEEEHNAVFEVLQSETDGKK